MPAPRPVPYDAATARARTPKSSMNAATSSFRPRRRSLPGPGLVCSAAASSAACSAWPRKASATGSPCSTRPRTVPPARVADRHLDADYLDPPRSRTLRESVRSRDDRIRERARRGARVPRARARVSRRAPPASRSPRTASAKRRFLPASGFAVAPLRGACARMPTRRRATRRSAARHREERAHRLRRQGAGAGAARATKSRGVRRDAAAALRARADDRPRVRGVGDRRARRRRRIVATGRSPRTGIATASSTCRSRPRASAPHVAAEAARHRDRRSPTALDYRGVLCVEMFVAPTATAARQRNRAAHRTTAAITRSTPA